MKRKNILISLLLFALSFNALHAYVIDTFDTHSCTVNEYIQEFSHPLSDDISDDICNLHSAFHIVFILPQHLHVSRDLLLHVSPQTVIKSYAYTPEDKFLKPPRHA